MPDSQASSSHEPPGRGSRPIPGEPVQSPEPATPLPRLAQRLSRALREHVWLLLTVLVLLPFSVWAVLLDDAPGHFSDAIMVDATGATFRVERDGLAGLASLAQTEKLGPVSMAMGLVPLLLLGVHLAAVRVGSLACYLALIVLTYAMTRRAGGDRSSAAWAGLLCGTSPLVFGYGRLEYPDIHVATLCAACLHVMLAGRLRWQSAVALGTICGLGLLTKLSFVATIVAPGLWFLSGHLRRASLRHLGLAALTVGLVAGWWYAVRLDFVVRNAVQSTGGLTFKAVLPDEGGGWLSHVLATKLDQVCLYVWQLPGMALLWGLAGLGLVLARRTISRHGSATLMYGSFFVCLTLLAFDSVPRYVIPVVPAAAALGGLAISRVLSALPARPRRLVAGVLVAGLLGWFGWLNVVPRWNIDTREVGAGAIRPITTYDAMCRALKGLGASVNVHYAPPILAEWLTRPDYWLEGGQPCRFPSDRHHLPGARNVWMGPYEASSGLTDRPPGTPLDVARRAASALGIGAELSRKFSMETGISLVALPAAPRVDPRFGAR